MPDLKPIHRDAIPRALAKAERYRLLNEPSEAESICLDVLAVDAGHQEARACLILALTDTFGARDVRVDEARRHAEALTSAFDRAYYAGVVEERWAKALAVAGYAPGQVRHAFNAALSHFETAQRLAPAGNDDAVLRWNACVRAMDRHGLTGAEAEHEHADTFDDDVPPR